MKMIFILIESLELQQKWLIGIKNDIGVQRKYVNFKPSINAQEWVGVIGLCTLFSGNSVDLGLKRESQQQLHMDWKQSGECIAY